MHHCRIKVICHACLPMRCSLKCQIQSLQHQKQVLWSVLCHYFLLPTTFCISYKSNLQKNISKMETLGQELTKSIHTIYKHDNVTTSTVSGIVIHHTLLRKSPEMFQEDLLGLQSHRQSKLCFLTNSHLIFPLAGFHWILLTACIRPTSTKLWLSRPHVDAIGQDDGTKWDIVAALVWSFSLGPSGFGRVQAKLKDLVICL